MSRFDAASRRAADLDATRLPGHERSVGGSERPDGAAAEGQRVVPHPAAFSGGGAAAVSSGVGWRRRVTDLLGGRRHRHPSKSAGTSDPPRASDYEKIAQFLHEVRRDRGQAAICVLSAVTGEGVSSVARQTAAALAGGGAERVALVDADGGESTRLRERRSTSAVGLTDVLAGRVSLGAALRPGEVRGVTFLAHGPEIEVGRYLPPSSHLPTVISELRRHHDWLIVDGPPVTTRPDAAFLAHCVGAALLVIRAESTRWEVVEEARRILENGRVEVLGAVLNRRRYHVPDFIYRRI